MTAMTWQESSFNDAILLRLAREIAMDIRPIQDILGTYEIDESKWQLIQQNHTFKGYLRGAIEVWASATNTQERVRVKALAMVEESLAEFYARMHDADEALQHKTEVLKTITKLAGLETKAGEGGGGEKFTVTINLGADQQVHIEKDITPQVTITADVEEADLIAAEWETLTSDDEDEE